METEAFPTLTAGGTPSVVYLFPTEGGTLHLDTEVVGSPEDVVKFDSFTSFRGPRMNNMGVDGFSKIAAVGGYETEGRYLVIFTPYFLTP